MATFTTTSDSDSELARKQELLGLEHLIEFMKSLDDFWFDFASKRSEFMEQDVGDTKISLMKNWVSDAAENSPTRIGYTAMLGDFSTSSSARYVYVHNADQTKPAVNRLAAIAGFRMVIEERVMMKKVEAPEFA